MSEFFDVEYEIEKRFIKGLRTVFEKDTTFRYNRNCKESNVQITGEYPDSEYIPEQTPQIVVSGASYQNNTQTTFGYNFMDNRNKDDINSSIYDHAYIIPYNVTIICASSKSTSKDLASKVAWYLSFAASKYFSEDLELQINNLSKGNTTPSEQFPQKIFDTPISVQGTIYWVGSKGAENDLLGIDKPLKGIKINFK